MKTAWMSPLVLLTTGLMTVSAQQPAADAKCASAATPQISQASAQFKTPPWGIVPAPAWPEPPGPPPPALPAAPEKVVIPAGTRIAVTLDTPLSTRISKPGQLVNFRTSEALPVYEGLVIPPDTLISGAVTEAHKPGTFGKQGVLRVKVDHIQLANGASAELAAKLDSQDLDGQGRLKSDNNRAANLASVALWTAQGSLLGAQIHGGKGAAVGAGAGATVALLLLMARHGSDVYLEPGTPFLVQLDQPVSLPGAAVQAVQPGIPSATDTAGEASGAAAGSPAAGSTSSAATNDPSTDPARPKLKHRPKPPQP